MRLYICTVGLVVAPDRNVTGKDRRERAKRQHQSETSEGNGTKPGDLPVEQPTKFEGRPGVDDVYVRGGHQPERG